jgi:hypothetical protein
MINCPICLKGLTVYDKPKDIVIGLSGDDRTEARRILPKLREGGEVSQLITLTGSIHTMALMDLSDTLEDVESANTQEEVAAAEEEANKLIDQIKDINQKREMLKYWKLRYSYLVDDHLKSTMSLVSAAAPPSDDEELEEDSAALP